MDDGAILVTNLNSVCKNTQETQISFHVTKIMFTGVTFRNVAKGNNPSLL